MVLPVVNPRTGEADYWIDPARPEDIRTAAARLRAEQSEWRASGREARAKCLHEWALAIAAARQPLVASLSVDTGRVALAQVEVNAVIGILERWASRGPGILDALDRDEVPSATPGIVLSNRHVPYPLIGVIAPWNFPLLLALIDAIPALMAGCAVLIKPSEVTPRFIRVLRDTLTDERLAQVVELVEGDADTGRAVVENVDYLCFTGSVATGRKVAEAAARAFIPANLELGGKDPMIILPSADPLAAAGIALRASVAASGQACQSIERVYVHDAIAEPFLAALVEQARAAEPNFPDIASGVIGPFIFPEQADKVQAQIDAAIAQGATVLSGGTVETLGGGRYMRPTVLTGVSPAMALMTEETFGPVIPVTVYTVIDDAIRQANDSAYGLSAAVIGDPAEAAAVAERLEAGVISINDGALTTMVFDATNTSFKLSGMGPSRMGDEGLTRFLRTQAILRQDGSPLPLAAYEERGSTI